MRRAEFRAPAPPGISATARNMAAFRALESVKPRDERLFDDPYAKRFLSPWQRLLVRCSTTRPVRRLVERCVDRLVPGARTSGVTRTRLIDDWLRREVAGGAHQLVVLGAGFDCRALRLPELASVPTFEVDRPAMVTLKTQILGDRRAANVTRVAVDFLKDGLADRLRSAGYAPGRRTLFLWEGVTNYLDDRSVAAVLDFVAGSTPAGSRIVFTYVHADAVAGRFDAPGLAPLLARLKERGEPWTFGFAPDALPADLARHGLKLVADLGAAAYRRLYWPTLPIRVGYEFYRVAMAETAADAAR